MRDRVHGPIARAIGRGLILSACPLFLSGCNNGSTQTPPPVSVTLTPARGGLVVTQSITLAASVANDSQGLGVTWSATGGAFTNQAAATAVYTAPPTAGTFTITATSKADTTKSASATFGVTDLAGVFTWHNDLARTGQNLQEFALTPSLVKTAMFGKLFSCAVDGAVYVQPLWVANLTLNAAKRNVVFAATQHDSVYAFDADANPCAMLWHANLLDPAHGGTAGETPVPSSGGGALVGNGFGDINPEVAVTGTPVIDPNSNTLYVVSKSVIASPTPPIFFQRLHALDLATGNEKFSGPAAIAASVAGTGDGSSGSTLSFDAQSQNQRPGLALFGGNVYIAWASHEDAFPYHGWVLAYNAANLTLPPVVFNTTPNGGLGGIWMSAAAPAFDTGGNLYFATGNGSFNGTDEFGDSVLKLSPLSGGNFTVLDYFTPFNQASLSAIDGDLGAGGSVVLPDPTTGTHRQLLVQVGKDGTIYLLDRSNLGKYCDPNPPSNCSSDTQIVQELPNAINGMWGTPAYWNGTLYFGGAQIGGTSGDSLKAFSFSADASGQFLLSTSPTSMSLHVFNFSGPTPSVSANGTSNGIVWVLDNSQYGPPTPNGSGPTVLHAYDAANLSNELWNSSQAANNRDLAGNAVKFTVPTVANGKVYVGTRTELDVYGLLPN